MKIAFINKRLNSCTQKMIDQANTIIDEYMAQGFVLTLRQLYYQFVARGLLANKQQEYKRLGNVMTSARLLGLTDWDALEDRGRNLIVQSTWDSPKQIIESAARQYNIDLWADQPCRPEVWVEKEALAGVFAGVCAKWRVPLFPCKGYVSISMMFDAGYNRFREYSAAGQSPVILHFGDHDPSGIDMTRDITERLQLFAGEHMDIDEIDLTRMALNMDQVQKFNPPPNPAKVTDSRFESYLKKFGRESWELDALDPKTLAELVEKAVTSLIVEKKFGKARRREERERGKLMKMAKNYK